MINRQQLIQNELEQMLLQNQQKDEFLMMLMAFNKNAQLNEYQYLKFPSANNNYFNPNQNFHSQVANPQISSLNYQPSVSIPPYQQNQVQNYYNNSSNNMSMKSNINNNLIQQYLNSNPDNNIHIQNHHDQKYPILYNENNFAKSLCNRDSDTKKNQDLSDFSMHLEESTTRMSLNRNSFGFNQQQQQQQQQQASNSQSQSKCDQTPLLTSSSMPHYASMPLSSKYLYSNEQDNHIQDYTLNSGQTQCMEINQKVHMKQEEIKKIKIQSEDCKNLSSNNNQRFCCGYNFIQKTENNSNISKIQKNPIISRLADYLSYVYTFESHRLENEGILEDLFSSSKQLEVGRTNSKCKSEYFDQSQKMPTNTTVIRLNNSHIDDPLFNLNQNQIYSQNLQKTNNTIDNITKKIIVQQQGQSNCKPNDKESISFCPEFCFKPALSQQTQQLNNSKKINIKEENIVSISDEDYTDMIDEVSFNKNQSFLKKGQSSLRFNRKITETIENFLKNKLMIRTKESSTENEAYYSKLEQKQKAQNSNQLMAEKVKGMKGLLDFEDIQSLITLETSINEDQLNKEIQQILHHFKSNHKVYFKKVRSQKEMLKDTKFHNLNKRIMRVLLQILNNPIILSLKVPKPIYNFFLNMSQKLINSSKKLIKNTVVNDQYSHAHYNTMFLQISGANYQRLSQSQSDVDLHKIIYDIDLSLPFSHNYYEIQKTNILKQYIFLILDRTLRLNDTSKDTQIQSIRSMYIERVIKGMEKMNAGKIVQRF